MNFRIALILGLSTLVAIPGSSLASTNTTQELKTLGNTAGNKYWSQFSFVAADGVESIDGFKCRVHTLVDLHNGQWRKTVHCPVFSTARGIDSEGAWRQDHSGQVHSLDSSEAKKLAITDRWLNRNGPYFPNNDPAELKRLPAKTIHKEPYQRIAATPAGGRTVTLWIGGKHDLVARTVMRRSFQIKTTDYSDYRSIDGVMLPFRIVTSMGKHAQPRILTINRYQLLRSAPRHVLRRPDNRVTDVQIPAQGTRVPLKITPSGWLQVEVRINGKGPFPFFLDTGGADIVTPETAQTLGLNVSGHGLSYGAGAGSTPTSYTRVKSISLGKARIANQPMRVIHFSPLITDQGNKPPIAGLLGFEFLERFAVTIDLADQKLILQPFDSFRAPKGATALPIRFTSTMPLVPATLDGKTGIFGMDTGNNGPLMIFPTWAQHNGLTRYYKAGLPEPEGGVGGMFTAHMAYIHSLKLGGLTVPEKQLGLLTPHGVGSTSNPSQAGNLGMSVWRAFRFTLDYRNEHLYLISRPDYTPQVPSATGGFRAVKFTPKAFTVIKVAPKGPAANAGLKKGDQITEVNGIKAENLASLYLMTYLVKSKPGTHLQLTCSNGHTLNIVLVPNTAMQKALTPSVK